MRGNQFQFKKKTSGSKKFSFREKVFEIVKTIPEGETMTYKEVAVLAGNPRASRSVGKILNSNGNWPEVPCHRVICSNGSIGGWRWGKKKKAFLLKREGLLKDS